jgi:hypothetical protein
MVAKSTCTAPRAPTPFSLRRPCAASWISARPGCYGWALCFSQLPEAPPCRATSGPAPRRPAGRPNQQVKPFAGTQTCKLKANAGPRPSHDRNCPVMLFSPADWLQVPAANECKGAAFLFLSAKRSCEFDRAALSISVPDKGSEFHRWRPVRECSRGLGVQAGGAQMSSKSSLALGLTGDCAAEDDECASPYSQRGRTRL